MDANSKAVLRSRMKEAAQRREKRIDSPLVRYNELGQLVCKVCNVVVKSESLWSAHLASRQHKEVVEEIKDRAKAAGLTQGKATSEEPVKTETRSASSIPADFFDSPVVKHANKADPTSSTNEITAISVELKQQNEQLEKPVPLNHASEHSQEEKSGQASKGSLPEGFFDNVDADHKARGLEPPKYDIQDEWKEFQKSIREDLQEVDLRMEEEEFVAAEDREGLEYLKQSAFLGRIENLRKRKLEMEVARATKVKSVTYTTTDMSESSASDGDSDVDLLVDWRAKQLK